MTTAPTIAAPTRTDLNADQIVTNVETMVRVLCRDDLNAMAESSTPRASGWCGFWLRLMPALPAANDKGT
jgi:hypothetical protein